MKEQSMEHAPGGETVKEKFKPCPICGSKEHRIKWHVGLRIYDVYCIKCKFNVTKENREEAIAAWNKCVVSEK